MRTTFAMRSPALPRRSTAFHAPCYVRLRAPGKAREGAPEGALNRSPMSPPARPGGSAFRTVNSVSSKKKGPSRMGRARRFLAVAVRLEADVAANVEATAERVVE